MFTDPPNPETTAAVLISMLSGFISIARRVINGHPATILWVITEFATAILCGYLMANAYPRFEEASWLPHWCTLPVAVAMAAHIGGKLYQEAEKIIIAKYSQWFKAWLSTK